MVAHATKKRRTKEILRPTVIVIFVSFFAHLGREYRQYYNKRINELGKNKMSTLNIIRNKLIYRVFAVVNRGTPYIDLYKFAA